MWTGRAPLAAGGTATAEYNCEPGRDRLKLGPVGRQHALLVAFDSAFVRAEEAESGVLVNVVGNEALVVLAAQEISKRY